MIPFIDLPAQHKALEEELLEVFRNALKSAAFIGGHQVEEFEKEFAAFCGTKYCVGVNSVAQAITEIVKGENTDGDDGRRNKDPGVEGEGLVVLRFLNQHAPTGDRRAQPQPQEAQGRFGQDHGRHGQRRDDDNRPTSSRDEVSEDDVAVAGPRQSRRADVIGVAQG